MPMERPPMNSAYQAILSPLLFLWSLVPRKPIVYEPGGVQLEPSTLGSLHGSSLVFGLPLPVETVIGLDDVPSDQLMTSVCPERSTSTSVIVRSATLGFSFGFGLGLSSSGSGVS